MQRTVSTVLFALSLLPLGCSIDTEPDGHAGSPPEVTTVSGLRGEQEEGDDDEDGDGDQERDEDEERDEDQEGDEDDNGKQGDDEDRDDGDEQDRDKGDDDEDTNEDIDTDVAVPSAPSTKPSAAAGVALPPVNASFDYQLGGDYPLPSGVRIVSRDRTGSAAAGAYNICYLNGLQTQPGERSTWLSSHPELLLRKNGQVVSDPEWKDELLLDISTAQKRSALVELETAWITACKNKGFSAIEVDNLDSYSRSGGLLTSAHAVAYIRLLSDRAHAAGLAIAQKNSAELAARKLELGTDFAVAEECAKYDECDAYTKAYGKNVLIIEYTRAAFQKACSQQPELSIVLRDVELVTPGTSGYVREGC